MRVVDIVDDLTSRGVSVNTCLLANRGNASTFPLHVAVDISPKQYIHGLVEYFLSQGADCNILDSHGYAPLHYAAIRCNFPAAQALLDAGANVNLKTNPADKKGGLLFQIGLVSCRIERSFPLHMTMKARNCSKFEELSMFAPGDPENDTSLTDLVQCLLSHGAQCNVFDWLQVTPLHYAVALNDITITNMLLGAGADINAIYNGRSSHSPLYVAKDVTMLKFLMSRNADPEIHCVDVDGQTVLGWFFRTRRIDITRYLISDMPIFMQTNNISGSPLMRMMEDYSHHAMKFETDTAETIYLMIMAGSGPAVEVLKSEEWTPLRSRLVSNPRGAELVKNIEEISYKPRPLLNLCTIRIRRILRKDVHKAVEALPLPDIVKEILLMDTSNDHAGGRLW